MRNGDKDRSTHGLQYALQCARDTRSDIFYIHEPYANLKDVFRSEDVIVFLREPVQRVVSHFCHRLRTGVDETFESFVTRTSNWQSHFTRELSLSRAFVGIAERYTESVRRLSRHLGRELHEVAINLNPDKTFGIPYQPTSDELALIVENNRDDIELYERVRRNFESPSQMLNSWVLARSRRRRERVR